MIDAHVHLEKDDYSVEWIKQFVEYAVNTMFWAYPQKDFHLCGWIL